MNSGIARSVLPPSSSSGYTTDSDVFDDDHMFAQSSYSTQNPRQIPISSSHSNVVDWARSVHLEASSLTARTQAQIQKFELYTQNFVQLVSSWTDSQESRNEALEIWKNGVLETLDQVKSDVYKTCHTVAALEAQVMTLNSVMVDMKKAQAQTNDYISSLMVKMDSILLKTVANPKAADSKTHSMLLPDDDETLLSDSENTHPGFSDMHNRRLLPSSPGPFEMSEFVESL